MFPYNASQAISSRTSSDAATSAIGYRKLRQLLLKLSLKYGKLPHALLLNDVQCSSDDGVSGGFADVYRGTYKGLPVAIKRIRVAQASSEQKPGFVDVSCLLGKHSLWLNVTGVGLPS